MIRLFCDGSTTRICYKFENHMPIIIPLLKKVSSNEGEYIAIIKGLEAAIRLHWKDIVVISDSQLIVNQLTRAYKIKKQHLQVLASEVLRLARKLDKVEFQWIKREKNEAGIALETIK